MDNRKIVHLKGPDRIRLRPAVVFGTGDIHGAWEAVRNLLEIFVTEALLGHGKRLSVKQDGAVLEISGEDRGLYLGQDSGDDSPWQRIFCEMYPMPAYRPDEGEYVLGLIGSSHHMLYGDEPTPNSIYFPGDKGYFELYAAQCVSRFMDVTVRRDGVCSTLHFEKGHNMGGITHTATTEGNGTCFRLAMDEDVFTETVIPVQYILAALEEFAILAPGLSCTYENGSVRKSFCYEGGSVEYMQKKCAASAQGVFGNTIAAKGRERYDRAEYEACVEIAIGYTPDAGGVKCLHNFKHLTYGGAHYNALQKALCDAFNSCYRSCLGETPLTFEELTRHLSVLLITRCSPYCSHWENGSRLAIRNRVIADMTKDALVPAFENNLYDHKIVYQELIDKILAERSKN